MQTLLESKSGMATLISDKINFGTRNITNDRGQ